MTDIEYMKLALIEAKKSLKSEDVPVGAVIVLDDKVIAVAHNAREKDNKVVAHAEINAITKAGSVLGRYRLDGAVIYITKEPCLMCMGAILSARISKIVYGANDLRFGTSDLATNNRFNHKCKVVSGVLEEDCSELITNFFRTIRGNNANTRKNNNRS